MRGTRDALVIAWPWRQEYRYVRAQDGIMRMIGVDIGGTFTDIVFTDTLAKRIVIYKVPTTADDPERGMVSGIIELRRRHAIPAPSIDHILHGTTKAAVAATFRAIGMASTNHATPRRNVETDGRTPRVRFRPFSSIFSIFIEALAQGGAVGKGLEKSPRGARVRAHRPPRNPSQTRTA